MTDYQRNHIEILIDQIDEGLLSIYNARTEGYRFIDFDFLLKDLLSSDGIAQYDSTVKKYIAVFTDLSRSIGTTIIQTLKIDLSARTRKVKEIYHQVQFGDVDAQHIETEKVVDIDEKLIGAYKTEDPAAYNDIRLETKKIHYYTGGNNADHKATIHDLFFYEKQGFEDIFRRSGFTDGNAYFTFEKYVRSILNKREHSLTQQEARTGANTSKSEARKKILLMREMGVLKTLVDNYSKVGEGTLNDKELSELVAEMIGENAATVEKDLMLIHNNAKGSKDRPINDGSVKKIKSLFAKYGLQVKYLGIYPLRAQAKILTFVNEEINFRRGEILDVFALK